MVKIYLTKINLSENWHLFLKENIFCGYSLEAAQSGASNVYSYVVFKKFSQNIQSTRYLELHGTW